LLKNIADVFGPLFAPCHTVLTKGVIMHALTRRLLVGAMGIAPILGLSFTAGCEHTHTTVVAAAPADDVVVAPGYYYDAEYYDGSGHFHPRRYWYYDGHRWDGRDGVPSGYHVTVRPQAHRDDHQDDHRDHRDDHQ
jgi:hypothetical protein